MIEEGVNETKRIYYSFYSCLIEIDAMAGRPGRSKKNVSQKTQTISTQTSPDRYAVDLDLLRKEMRQLKLEIRVLKKKDEPDSGATRNKTEEKTVQKTVEKTVVAQADSPQALKLPAKGCSCKGKCNKKACGCVKKQTACTELCKCDHSRCENQEPDKENEAAPKPRAKTTSEKNNLPNRLDAVTVRRNKQEVAGPSNKRVEEVKKKKPAKSLFSPDTSEIHEYRSAKEFDTNETLSFGTLKKRVQFDSDGSGNSPKENRRKLKLHPNADKARVEASNDSSEGKKDPRLKQKAAKARVEGNVSPMNPMKPTRQLLRTPPSMSTSLSSSLNRSEVQQPVVVRAPSPLPMLFKVRHHTPTGLDEPQIDWDEHYRQLVPCKLCNRTFNPDRIKKHESNCKKV